MNALSACLYTLRAASSIDYKEDFWSPRQQPRQTHSFHEDFQASVLEPPTLCLIPSSRSQRHSVHSSNTSPFYRDDGASLMSPISTGRCVQMDGSANDCTSRNGGSVCLVPNLTSSNRLGDRFGDGGAIAVSSTCRSDVRVGTPRWRSLSWSSSSPTKSTAPSSPPSSPRDPFWVDRTPSPRGGRGCDGDDSSVGTPSPVTSLLASSPALRRCSSARSRSREERLYSPQQALGELRRMSNGGSAGGLSEPRALCGLKNLGNTCFMNACIQCLSNSPPLALYLLRDVFDDTESDSDESELGVGSRGRAGGSGGGGDGIEGGAGGEVASCSGEDEDEDEEDGGTCRRRSSRGCFHDGCNSLNELRTRDSDRYCEMLGRGRGVSSGGDSPLWSGGSSSSGSSGRSGELLNAFGDLIRTLWSGRPMSSVSPTELLEILHELVPQFAPDFAGYMQHDSQEFLRTFVDRLDEECSSVMSAAGAHHHHNPGHHQLQNKSEFPLFVENLDRCRLLMDCDFLPEAEQAERAWEHHRARHDSAIQRIFGGQLQSTIECATCHHRSYCFDPFLDLSLPIPPKRYGRWSHSVNIVDCMSAFVAEERLEGDDAYNCQHCGSPQPATKKLSLFRFPPVLVIHIKRISSAADYSSFSKDSTLVDFDLEGLDLSPYLSPSADMMTESKPIYDLYAVTNHVGGLSSGHYTAFCKNVDDGLWYTYNDSVVSRTQPSSVISPAAYVLFYQKRETVG